MEAEPYSVGIVGCGYAADFYLANFKKYSWLRIGGAFDCDKTRLAKFVAKHSLHACNTFDELLNNTSISLVLNLTNPDSHYVVSKAALSAGKHVYSEKPFATSMKDAFELIEIAARNNVQLASAPCTVLGRSAQTIWKLIREGRIGNPLIAIADLSDGMIHRQPHHLWISCSGAPWPATDEFRMGCLIEHGEYVISWLTNFFGRVSEVAGTSDTLVTDKGTGRTCGPDFGTGLLRFEEGPVARLSFSSLTPHDRSLTIVGTDGVARIADVWNMNSPVELRTQVTLSSDPNEYLAPAVDQALVGHGPAALYKDSHNIDQMQGVAEMVQAIRLGREPRLIARRSIHNLEVLLAINGSEHGKCVSVQTRFDRMEPMSWAR